MIQTGLWGLIEQGGVVMLPLVLSSVVAVAVALERTWTLARDARAARILHELVDESLRGERGLAEAVAISRRDSSSLGAVYLAVLATPVPDAAARRDLAERRLAQAARQSKRYVWLLGTIGSLAPFIGLFGTVVGIIRAFESMAATGSGGFTVVAAGISEALIATAGGLLVGVLAIFAYNALVVRANNLMAELREDTDELLAGLELPARREGAAASVRAR